MEFTKKMRLISLVIFLFTGMPFFVAQAQDQDPFYPCQSISTHGALDWESFTIGTDTFLAVAKLV